MDESWERERNGSTPSFQEFLAAEHVERQKFVDAYIARRGLSSGDVDRDSLESFLAHAGSGLGRGPAQAERALDALLRVRAERVLRTSTGSRRGDAA